MLDDGQGTPVGYIIGTASTADFAKRWTRDFVPSIDRSQVPMPAADETPLPRWESNQARKILRLIYHDQAELLMASYPELWDKWPAHLHIDIRDAWQRRGYGKKLIRVFSEKMKREGAQGVHLGMVATNEGAGQFYTRLGFSRFPHVLDDGKSGELGRLEGGIVWVSQL